MLSGKVIKSTGKNYTVLLPNGDQCNATLRGKIRLSDDRLTNPVAVGDDVLLEKSAINDYQIAKINDRKNFIVRKSTNLSKKRQIIAANVDLAVLLVTLKSPQTQLGFIDRFLVSAEAFRIPVILCFSKIDQYNQDELKEISYLKVLYKNAGYDAIDFCSSNNELIEQFKKIIKGKQVVISGHSGVGKSSLVNALDNSIELRTGELSTAHMQGQHTTTFAEMIPLNFGAYIIDTPGIRAFGVIDMEKEFISHYFPEMRAMISSCKFHNCIHLNEPACAVKKALTDGKISKERYQSYVQLMEEDQEQVHRENKYKS